MDEDGLAGVWGPGALACPHSRNGGTNLGEGGFDVRRFVEEGGAVVADGDADELDPSLVSS